MIQSEADLALAIGAVRTANVQQEEAATAQVKSLVLYIRSLVEFSSRKMYG